MIFFFLEKLITNDHETPERIPKPSTSIPRYQNKSGEQIKPTRI